jgi:hypothetical protein
LQRVERIRATLNEAIEKGSNVKFSSRRQLGKARKDEDEDFGGSFPALDIMSDLTEVDVVGAAPNRDAYQHAPRKRLNRDGVAEWGGPVAPLTCVEHLFTRGVCQVRHNIVHGNKLDLNERDMKLTAGAHFVLESAISETKLLA